MSDKISTRVFTSYTNKDGCIVQHVWKIKEGYFISVSFSVCIAALSIVWSHACRVNRQENRNNSANSTKVWSLASKPDVVSSTRYFGDKRRVSQPRADLDLRRRCTCNPRWWYRRCLWWRKNALTTRSSTLSVKNPHFYCIRLVLQTQWQTKT